MADWTDGPEYAPTHRPEVFVEPDATGLPTLEAPVGPAPHVPPGASPAARPDYDGPDAAPLDSLAPPVPQTRDPQEAFDVVSTPMTSWSARPLPPPDGDPAPLPPPPPTSAWGHAHAYGQPHAQSAPLPPVAPVPAPPPAWPPAQVNPGGFPPPGPPPWEPPPPAPPFEPVTVGSIVRSATPGVLISLAVAALVHPLSLLLVVVASVLAVRVRYRRRLVGRLFSGAILGSFALGMLEQVGLYGTFDVLGWYDRSTGWAQLAALALFVAVPLVVGDALRRGEAPEEGW